MPDTSDDHSIQAENRLPPVQTTNPEADPTSPGTARAARAAQFVFLSLGELLLLGAFITSAGYNLALSGLLGVVGVWTCSSGLALIAIQYVWLSNRGFFGEVPSPETKATHRSRLLLFWTYLIVILVAQHHIRSLDHWGLAVGHDQPQYYVYLHSWVFDRDLEFNNEYKMIPGTAEMMWENHSEIPNYNVAPIGSAIVWMPYYLIAIVMCHVMNAVGIPMPLDGMASPYAMAVIFGGITSAFLGLLCIHASLRHWFSERVSFWTVMVLLAGSPLLWYILDEPLMSHSSSFFMASVVFWLWVRGHDRRTLPQWILLGAAIGLAMCVRPNHAVLLLLAVADAIRQMGLNRTYARCFAGLGLCIAAALAVFSLQLLTWYLRFGANPPPGAAVDWLSPDFVQILFSTQNGVIAWHPVLALGFLGLPLVWHRSRYAAVLIAMALLIYTYFNAALWDWWGGGSFGMRRFVCVLPFFTPGLAAASQCAANLIRKRPSVVMIPAVALILVYNVMLMVQSRRSWTSYNEPKSFQFVLMGAAASFHESFGSPFSFPANLWFALRHRVPLSQYDVSTGVPLRPWVELKGLALKPVLGSGWYHKTLAVTTVQGAAVANARESEVFVHLRDNQAFVIEMTLEAPLSIQGTQLVSFHLNGKLLGQAELNKDTKTEVRLDVPADLPHFGTNVLHFSWSVVTENRAEDLIQSMQYGGLKIPNEEPIRQAGYLYRLAVKAPEPSEQP
ncbi:MAG: hypothetical protein AMXMBFR84_31950 [Candidatus Hydrogenedentota bacterium]